MSNYTIIPSGDRYKAAPESDQKIVVSLESQQQEMVEYDRSSVANLAEVFDRERQKSSIFRPTFKVNFIYENTITGTTEYLPLQYNLYYVDQVQSKFNGVWKGYPQYYEFDFYRPNINDGHFQYSSKSAYTYNWTYYLSYASQNDYYKSLYYEDSEFDNISWVANEGIPFIVKNVQINGDYLIQLKCISNHGIKVGEYVELSFDYNDNNLFQVYSLGDGTFESEKFILNIFNIGFTGTTFEDNTVGKLKRVINVDNINETKSKYYVRVHKILTDVEDIVITKNGFEKNPFKEDIKYEFSSITPNDTSRISKRHSNNSYNITLNNDLDISNLFDNQMRPISKLYLTIINKGYSGLFNRALFFNNNGIQQGWEFNVTSPVNSWWNDNNVYSNSNIPTESYVKTSGVTKTFYYNKNLNKHDFIDGDFCEWNDYEEKERVISPYYHKIKFNREVFNTTIDSNFTVNNGPGYYYKPHSPMTIRVFSDYIETGDIENLDGAPTYAFYSKSDKEFRWRDIYSYGFIDGLGNGVDYPFLNNAHYPFENVIFKLIPEGMNYSEGYDTIIKPLIDYCE